MQHGVDPVDQEDTKGASCFGPQDQPASGRIRQRFDGAAYTDHDEEDHHEARVGLDNGHGAPEYPVRARHVRTGR